MRKSTRAFVTLLAGLSLSTVLIAADAPTSQPSKKVTPSGLTIIELGQGDLVAAAGDKVWVEYSGKLENGTVFDASSRHPEQPLIFVIGKGQVIAGWDEGIAGMKVGQKRQLIIPAKLGYGDQAAGEIPPNSTLIFDVQLIGLKKGDKSARLLLGQISLILAAKEKFMNRLGKLSVGVCSMLLMALSANAEVKVTVSHNDNDHASADFKFKEVPSPSKTDAATSAKFAIVDGEKDDNGGELDVMHDGKLPAEQDEPTSNFFFASGSEGGSFSIDLAARLKLKKSTPTPGTPMFVARRFIRSMVPMAPATDLMPPPKKGVDPTTVGWKLIAKVDTRPKTGDAGGHYGVSISDSGGAVGKFRYLLLVSSRTEGDDENGNTFFSEVDVIDAKEMVKDPAAVEKAGVKQVVMGNGKFHATIDTTETPDLSGWANEQLAPLVVEWYPKLVDMLPSDGYDAPTNFSITFRAKKPGVADTMGTRINCAADWFRQTLHGEAKGAILHEMVHVVQQYGNARHTNPHPNANPGWLVEGIADYVRWYDYEPQSHGTTISKRNIDKAKYDSSYRITANFLDYVSGKYDKSIVSQMNTAMRQGKYSDDLWKQYTGKTAPELGDEWKSGLEKSLGMAPSVTTKSNG